jgi:hypothetical protein
MCKPHNSTHCRMTLRQDGAPHLLSGNGKMEKRCSGRQTCLILQPGSTMSGALMEIMRPIVVVIVCLLFAPLLGSAAAAELDDKVAGRADLTYYDLVKLIVSDLLPADSKGEPSAHDIASYRHIEGASAKTEPAGPVAVKYVSPFIPAAREGSRCWSISATPTWPSRPSCCSGCSI